MKNILKLAITLLVAYLVYRLLTEFLQPVSVRLDDQPDPDPLPPVPEPPPPSTLALSPAPRDAKPQRVNINEADVATLTTLPGVGPALAERVVAYREEAGPFKSSADLTNVSGIGTVLEQRLRPLLAV
jgi:competence protein ComEA